MRVRLVDGAGQPVTSAANLTGLTAVPGAPGVFTVGGLTSTVAKAAASTSFPEEVRRTLLVGLATTGRLGDSVGFPALPSGRTLQRDFFTLRVLDLRSYLLGTPAADVGRDQDRAAPGGAARRAAHPAPRRQRRARRRGGGAGAGRPTESLAVAQRIDGAFAVPTAAGAAAHWPAFPPLGGVTAAPAGPVPVALVDAVAATAAFVTSTSTPPSPDVVLSLTGLPAGAAVRAYSRRFSAEAVETRGDGGGAVVDGAGGATILLRDPLGLVVYGRPQPPLPASPVLHVDLVVVKRTGESRILGDVSCPISTTTVAAPPTGTNPFGTAARRGICHAGILASGEPRTAPSPTAGGPSAALSLLSEGTPRDAPRLPGMARRELIVAGRYRHHVVRGGQRWPTDPGDPPRLGEARRTRRPGRPGDPDGRRGDLGRPAGLRPGARGLPAYDQCRLPARRPHHRDLGRAGRRDRRRLRRRGAADCGRALRVAGACAAADARHRRPGLADACRGPSTS